MIYLRKVLLCLVGLCLLRLGEAAKPYIEDVKEVTDNDEDKGAERSLGGLFIFVSFLVGMYSMLLCLNTENCILDFDIRAKLLAASLVNLKCPIKMGTPSSFHTETRTHDATVQDRPMTIKKLDPRGNQFLSHLPPLSQKL